MDNMTKAKLNKVIDIIINRWNTNSYMLETVANDPISSALMQLVEANCIEIRQVTPYYLYYICSICSFGDVRVATVMLKDILNKNKYEVKRCIATGSFLDSSIVSDKNKSGEYLIIPSDKDMINYKKLWDMQMLPNGNICETPEYWRELLI